MSTPEALIQAIKDRVAAGHDKETIKQETLAAGHTAEVFEVAYVAATDTDHTHGSDQAIPTVHQLWTYGLAFVKSEWRLAVYVAVPLMLFGIVDVLAMNSSWSPMFLVVGILSMLAFYIGIAVVLRVVAQPESGRDYGAALSWLGKNILGLIWVYLLTGFMVIGGYMLFIVPGVIASIALYFAGYVFVFGDGKGESALTKSRQLVAGRWWLVLKKVFGIAVYNFAVVIVLSMLGAMISVLLAPYVPALAVEGILAVGSQTVMVVLTFIATAAAAKLYVSLRDSVEVAPAKGVGRYRFLAAVGLIASVAIGFGIWYVIENEEMLSEQMGISDFGDMSAQVELFSAQAIATEYAMNNGDSFAGVCDEIDATGVVTASYECNDAEGAWALRAEYEGGAYCTDTTGYQKQLEAPLEERTECLPI